MELMKNKAKRIFNKFISLWHCFRVDRKYFSESPDNEVPFSIVIYSPCFIIYVITQKIIFHHKIPINS